MRVPKKFELHLATGDNQGDMQLDVIRVSDDGRSVEATDGVIAARVALGETGVQRAPGEELSPGAVIRAKAWAEATRGSTGEGELRLGFNEQRARSGEGKPELIFPPPETAGTERPPIDGLFQEALDDIFERLTITVNLDAEALVRLQRALGAKEGLSITLPVRRRSTGGCASPSGPIMVHPLEREIAAVGIIMPIVVEGRE